MIARAAWALVSAVTLLLSLHASQALATSTNATFIDCANPAAAADRVICDDPEMRREYTALAERFTMALDRARGPGREVLVRSQQAWLSFVREAWAGRPAASFKPSKDDLAWWVRLRSTAMKQGVIDVVGGQLVHRATYALQLMPGFWEDLTGFQIKECPVFIPDGPTPADITYGLDTVRTAEEAQSFRYLTVERVSDEEAGKAQRGEIEFDLTEETKECRILGVASAGIAIDIEDTYYGFGAAHGDSQRSTSFRLRKGGELPVERLFVDRDAVEPVIVAAVRAEVEKRHRGDGACFYLSDSRIGRIPARLLPTPAGLAVRVQGRAYACGHLHTLIPWEAMATHLAPLGREIAATLREPPALRP